MKKQTLVILFIFFSAFCWSQHYEKVDSIVLRYPKKFSSTLKIANQISSDFSNDHDKVRAVYTWITNNIIYDPSEFADYAIQYSTEAERDKAENEFRKKLSSRVLLKSKAVCEGYTTLFAVICDNLNIKSKIVRGGSKTLVSDIGKPYSSNHTWNIVVIDNKEYLIDVTWGAGSYEDRFVKKIDYSYFLTDPKQFIKNHYPDDYQNALLKEKIEKQEFLNAPVIHNFDFELIYPINGIIKKREAGQIKFKFLTQKKVNSILYNIDRKTYIIKEFKNNGSLEFVIDLSKLKNGKELILFFDQKEIVDFKLE
ncbi:MAG: transglutaminase domain-containing protein [Flavobacterium sp.]